MSALFSTPTVEWFTGAFDEPTAAQWGAWDAIARDHHAVVVAPTGSGKTLAAFLWAIDKISARTQAPSSPLNRCSVLYVSPLKALATDVERNLRAPLRGIEQAIARTGGTPYTMQVGVRTGDTPPSERRRFGTHPPDILITTPESLFLMLTSQARSGLSGIDTVIIDEVHSVAGTKRGAHLSVSLERLDAFLERPRPAYWFVGDGRARRCRVRLARRWAVDLRRWPTRHGGCATCVQEVRHFRGGAS